MAIYDIDRSETPKSSANDHQMSPEHLNPRSEIKGSREEPKPLTMLERICKEVGSSSAMSSKLPMCNKPSEDQKRAYLKKRAELKMGRKPGHSAEGKYSSPYRSVPSPSASQMSSFSSPMLKGCHSLLCRDPYCNSAKLRHQRLMAAATGNYDALSFTREAFLSNVVQPRTAPDPHAAPVHSYLTPHVCNWISGDTYCGRRYATAEDLLIHLRSHAVLPSSMEAASYPSYTVQQRPPISSTPYPNESRLPPPPEYPSYYQSFYDKPPNM